MIQKHEVNLKQLEANRLNAMKSTGPRTPEGKARSSMNALKHGLIAKQVVIPGEDPDEFEALLEDLIDEWKPRSGTELELIRQMATATWRLLRTEKSENGALEHSLEVELAYEQIPKDANALTQLFHKIYGRCIRRESGDRFTNAFRLYTRNYHKALNQLIELRRIHRDEPELEVPGSEKAKKGKTNPFRRQRKQNKRDPGYVMGPDPGHGPPERPENPTQEAA